MSDSGKLNNLPGDRGRGPAGEERELKIRASLSWRPCYPGSPVQQSLGAAPRDTTGPETSTFPVRPRFDVRMADNRTISHLEAEGYPWIGCECCKGTVWVPFKMLRERIPMLSAMTLDQLGAKMKCDRCGKRPERYYPANQSDTPGFVRRI